VALFLSKGVTMKLRLDGVGEGIYNKHEIHAFIVLECGKPAHSITPEYLNENILPRINQHFASKSHTIHEFLYDDQGAPVSFLITSNSSYKNLRSLNKALSECIENVNKDLQQTSKIGFFKPEDVETAKKGSQETSALRI
jgi:hypothetical protein